MVKIDGKVLNYKSSFKKESRSKPSEVSFRLGQSTQAKACGYMREPATEG